MNHVNKVPHEKSQGEKIKVDGIQYNSKTRCMKLSRQYGKGKISCLSAIFFTDCQASLNPYEKEHTGPLEAKKGQDSKLRKKHRVFGSRLFPCLQYRLTPYFWLGVILKIFTEKSAQYWTYFLSTITLLCKKKKRIFPRFPLWMFDCRNNIHLIFAFQR